MQLGSSNSKVLIEKIWITGNYFGCFVMLLTLPAIVLDYKVYHQIVYCHDAIIYISYNSQFSQFQFRLTNRCSICELIYSDIASY